LINITNKERNQRKKKVDILKMCSVCIFLY
jgi:hypothetical protein